MSTNQHRLARDVQPRHYDLNYTNVDLETLYFSGELAISVEVVKETNTITLHSLDLFIKGVKIVGAAAKVSSITTNFSAQTITLNLTEPLPIGQSKLEISFEGKLNDKLCGFYRSTYTVNGEKRTMALTQFEATDARRALPCWDEPAFKASFRLTITTRKDRAVVSNTHVVRTHEEPNKDKVGGGKKTWEFAVTPKMSTYLFAVVIGEFDAVSSYTKRNIQVTVYTPLGKADHGEFALNVAVKALDHYESVFCIPYPLPKSDLLAIPDFAAGAMENWGCVTYREIRLLADPKHAGVSAKTDIARVVCHELAHQWFGNLVTMEWWTHLWLNEGFARYMEFVAVNAIFPNWNSWDKFVYSVFNTALALDGLESTHAVEVAVQHPDEINEIFDTISYAKGASIIRMLASYIGLDNFFNGLHTYLTTHEYANAETEHLWAALEKSSGKPVQGIMAPWTSEAGFPLISVLATADGPQLTQVRFSANSVSSTSTVTWPVPLLVISADNLTGKRFLIGHDLEQTNELTALLKELDAKNAWFKLNSGQESLCRVNYTVAQWGRFTPVMASLSVIDRVGLVNDCFALAKAGHVPVTQPLELALSLRTDGDYLVWAELCSSLNELATCFKEADFYPHFQQFLNKVCEDSFGRLGWKRVQDESDDKVLWRSAVLSVLRRAAHPPTMQTAATLYRQSVADPVAHRLDADLMLQIFLVAAVTEGEKAWDQFLHLVRTSTQPGEKRNAMVALGRVPGMEQRTIELLFSEIRSQDVPAVVSGLCGSKAGRDLMWNTLQTRFSEIFELFSSTNFVWFNFIGVLVESFSSNDDAARIEAFFADPAHPPGSATRKLKQGLEAVRATDARLSRDSAVLKAWLQQKGF
eukprot:c6411_g1_i1.p1 GENE.c6411_g1_i1~~c6411_g1_i1.p1  ORF type:complete len:868 (-),score=216.56 c6411_g1_i1:110-2713(-)